MSHPAGSRHPSLQRAPADLVGGVWRELPAATHTAGAHTGGAGTGGAERGGAGIASHNPACPAEIIWSASPVVEHVDATVAAARAALPAWSAAGRERRFAVLRRFQTLCRERFESLAAVIRDETGKVVWEARAEVNALVNKVDITLEQSPTAALNRVSAWEIPLGPGRSGRTLYRPHGVMAVIGPFNFPAHLPNGHIVPALAMGNTIVFKPSDKAPAVGQALAELFADALEAEGFGRGGAGVVNLVQGAAATASRLVDHDGLDGILFTGSWPVGRRIMEANLDRPGRLLALEMGGNNAAVVMPDADLRQAAIEIVRSAFNTAGQRCTCTRRAIVHRDVADRLIPAMVRAASALAIGDSAAAGVFSGPMIRREARAAVLDAVAAFARADGRVLLEPGALDPDGRGGWYLTPGIVQVPRFRLGGGDGASAGDDGEVFGPLLRLSITDSLEDAIEQANATRFGLAASIFTKDAAAAERFLAQARAGCINVNTGTAGASSKLPFGGLGHSGNHRPAGSYSLDYCAYPVAAMVEAGGAATLTEGMRFEDAWIG